MAAKSSSAAATSRSGSDRLTWSTIHSIFAPHILPEPYFIPNTFGYCSVDDVYHRIWIATDSTRSSLPSRVFSCQIKLQRFMFCGGSPTLLISPPSHSNLRPPWRTPNLRSKSLRPSRPPLTSMTPTVSPSRASPSLTCRPSIRRWSSLVRRLKNALIYLGRSFTLGWS